MPDKEREDGEKLFPPIERETVSKADDRSEKAHDHVELSDPRQREDKSRDSDDDRRK